MNKQGVLKALELKQIVLLVMIASVGLSCADDRAQKDIRVHRTLGSLTAAQESAALVAVTGCYQLVYDTNSSIPFFFASRKGYVDSEHVFLSTERYLGDSWRLPIEGAYRIIGLQNDVALGKEPSFWYPGPGDSLKLEATAAFERIEAVVHLSGGQLAGYAMYHRDPPQLGSVKFSVTGKRFTCPIRSTLSNGIKE